MEKTYYTISEVCEMLDIKPHTIRYWETEFSHLKKKTKKGSIRRYTESDITLLKSIKDLIYNRKFTLEGAVAELKRYKSPPQLQSLEGTIMVEEQSNPVVTPTENKSNPKILSFKEELLEIRKILLKRSK